MTSIRLTETEFARRRQAVARGMSARNLELLCLFSPTQVFYLTGFPFLATERPIGVVFDPGDDDVTLFIPLLEREHAEEACTDSVLTYDEYPGECHPMKQLAAWIGERVEAGSRIGVDGDGYGGGYGYTGPRLSELVAGDVVVARDLIERMMRVKSEEEIALIRESCRWGCVAHRLLQEYSAPGLGESDISIRASRDASMQMIDALGPEYRAMRSGTFCAYAGFRGQVGTQSAVPHAITINAVLRPGDVLVTGAAAEIGGYLSELERTMILGEPTEEQARLFRLMVGAQDLAFEHIRPGARCSDVDRVLLDYYRAHDLCDTWRHHTGHSIGYGMHEAPFLDIGDETLIESGMVLTVEPGIYVPGFAGFRHSDTILVAEAGIEMLTDYPRDLETLTIPC